MSLRAIFKLTTVTVSALVIAACNVSTAHLDDIKIGTDKDVAAATTHFHPHDDVYALVIARNLPNKVSVDVGMIAKKVDGQKPDTALGWSDKTFDLESDGGVHYHLSPPPSGWPGGTYQIVATMDDEGTQRDRKSVEFTVTR